MAEDEPAEAPQSMFLPGDRLGIAVLAAALLVPLVAMLAAGRTATLEVAVPAEGEAPYRVDVNRADWAELSLVPGLGGVLARRIVEYRRMHGPYRSLDQLEGVIGIGKIRLESIRPYLSVTAAGDCGHRRRSGP